MPLVPQITFHHLDPSPAVEDAIREHAGRLERFHDRITSCRVVVETSHRHQRKGRIFHVGIALVLPGTEIVVKRDRERDHAHEDVYVAIRDAFDAARR